MPMQVLTGQLKKFKHTNAALEAEVAKRNNQMLVMEESLNVLKQQLQACSRTPADAKKEEQMKQELEAKDKVIQELSREADAWKRKVEVDAKLARQAQAQASREREAVHRQLIVQTANVEEKDL